MKWGGFLGGTSHMCFMEIGSLTSLVSSHLNCAVLTSLDPRPLIAEA